MLALYKTQKNKKSPSRSQGNLLTTIITAISLNKSTLSLASIRFVYLCAFEPIFYKLSCTYR